MGADPRTTLLTPDDIYLFAEGSHARLYDRLGAHPMTIEEGDGDAVEGTYFALWAPNAHAVSVIGDWNSWRHYADPMTRVADSGLWETFVPGARPGMGYKFHIVSRIVPFRGDKADPLAFAAERPPGTSSIIWDLDYAWGDREWMATRREKMALNAPMAIYEVHLGSWRRDADERPLGYREIAHELSDYATHMGFTHVELMPVMEHPYDPSWGYQITGYFAPTSRFGKPQDFMYMVDHLHQRGIGVILDWVPSHFPADAHGLGFFDGTYLYEHADPRKGYHPDWHSLIWNYGRPEVRSFLISSALFWLDRYHADGLRVDAVASMLYLDYSRKAGEWIPNEYGGRENLEAISLLRRANQEIYGAFPDTQSIAEESTSWPLVSRPPYVGGLGFGMKWDMGWMHDTLKYMQLDGVFRKFNHNKVTFRMMYAFSENFVLPLSHDEVVHGKGSLLAKMGGEDLECFANLRLLLAYMYTMPGKKLLFMGSELGQWREWSHERALDWDLLRFPPHAGIQAWVRDLNHLLSSEPALHELDFDPEGFQWIDCADSDASVISYIRRSRTRRAVLLAVFNFTPITRRPYRIGVPFAGTWQLLLNSDAQAYAGAARDGVGPAESQPIPWHGRPCSIELTIPGLTALIFRAAPPPPSASEILSRYVELHNEGVLRGAWSPIAALFHAESTLSFEGLTIGPFRGPRAIEEAFEAHGPSDGISASPVEAAADKLTASYRWLKRPDEDAGRIVLSTRDGLIVELHVTPV